MKFKTGDKVYDLDMLQLGLMIVVEIGGNGGFVRLQSLEDLEQGYGTQIDDPALIPEAVYNSPLYKALNEL